MNKRLWICLSAAATLAVSLRAEESATINRNHVNVRGAPTITSEVVTHLQKGDRVTFLEEISIDKPKTNEPAKWAAIKLPPDAHVWVFTGFLKDHTVRAPRLNLRAGPGENFSVLGRLEKGAQVKEIRVTDEWMEIEPPDNTRAYIDASYLDRGKPEAGQAVAEAEGSAPRASKRETNNVPNPLAEKPIVYEPPTKPVTTPTKTEPAIAEVPKEQPKVEKKLEEPKPTKSEPEPKPAETVAVKEQPAPVVAKDEKAAAVPTTTTSPAKPDENAAKPAEPAPATEAPAETPKRVLPPIAPAVAPNPNIPSDQKRIVRREGQVRSAKFNIQSPTYFELIGEKGRILNYLSGEKTAVKLKDYKGLRVIVTGEEGIDPRYPERPVLEIETIEVAP